MGHFVLGFGLGFFVALQVGPMSLFLIRSTLRAGWTVGLAIGAGIAIIDALYAACGAAGASALLTIEPLRVALAVVGAITLVTLGLRTLWSALRVRLGGESPSEIATPRRALMSSLAATASNPATIASWAAIFAAASVASAAHSTGDTVTLVVGVALGSLSWVSLLATATAAVRRTIGSRAMRLADTVAGLGLLGFGGALAYGIAHDR